MKQYYVHDGRVRKGPFVVDELRAAGLKPEYKVWCEGMGDWKTASDVEDLKFLFRTAVPQPTTPPRTPTIGHPAAPVASMPQARRLIFRWAPAIMAAAIAVVVITITFSNKQEFSQPMSIEVEDTVSTRDLPNDTMVNTSPPPANKANIEDSDTSEIKRQEILKPLDK